ncbi:unnamed protein product [Paramecium sonneborni]|uniref:Uncharacterized protein n=1 Tax=Paramecium sonneborni TaxID=65129 RepID=A0A8S1RJQ5_9CILI|nr:unnamed protein product [Paramecium sonneborni]
MDGNEDEWRILFHGTLNQFVASLLKNGLNKGQQMLILIAKSKIIQKKLCKGIYFSGKSQVCLKYARPIYIGNESFKVLFMSRVNPQKIKMC